MEERSSSIDGDDDEVLLPGFRFHPTDEELVAFYLKRKVQEKPLVIELIRQLDIYKYDPWDLPSLAPTTGEKEWYFYCRRDRKYKNSSRPNRVTAAGFWKATGTDRPVYSSQGGSCKCIGLKKSLVFYKGRAAKGTKTDWMMHEFRLPSAGTSLIKPHPLDKHINIHPNDSWAICRIFKKTTSMAQRMLNESMGHPILSNTEISMDHAFMTPNSRMPDTNNSIFCCPQPSTHMNFSSTDHHQFSVVDTLVSGAEEAAVMRKTNEDSFYMGNDHFKSWDSPSCPSEISGSWSSENCYNSFDELLLQ